MHTFYVLIFKIDDYTKCHLTRLDSRMYTTTKVDILNIFTATTVITILLTKNPDSTVD